MMIRKENIKGLFFVFIVIVLVLFPGCIGNNKMPGDNLNATKTKTETTTGNITGGECVGSVCSIDDLNQSSTKTSVKTLLTTTTTIEGEDNVTIELYHFHRTQQCYSCITVGALAEKTVNTYFKDELSSGKIVFGHVNIQLLENKNLVDKYGATGSSLWIGTYINGEFNKEQNLKVWYKINDEEDYLVYLKEVLEKRLSGNLEQI